MDVLLVRPATSILCGYREPLSLEYLAAHLENYGVETYIIDESATNVFKGIDKHNPMFVGISAMTPDIPRAREIAEFCSKRGIKTILGGIHATALPEETSQWADFVVVGDGESALLDIVVGNTKDKIIFGKEQDVTKSFFPARHLIDYEKYLVSQLGERTAAVITSRGCPFECIYCHNSIEKKKVRYNSIENAVSEVYQIKEKYNIERVFFQDDNFFTNSKRSLEILRQISPLKLGIECLTRAETIKEDVISKAREYGLDMVYIGFESASQKVLDRMNKKTNVSAYKNAVNVCKNNVVRITGSFMVGMPGETIEDIDKTKRFIEESNLYHVGIYYTIPYPGTKLWNEVTENCLLGENLDYDMFKMEDDNIKININPLMTNDEIKKARDTLCSFNPKQKTSLRFIWRLIRENPWLALIQLIRDWKKIPRLIKRLLS